MCCAVAAVVQNLRPPLRRHIPPALTKLLEQCWHKDSEARPSFAEAVGRLEVAQMGLDAWEEEEREQEAEGLAGAEIPGFLREAPGTPSPVTPSLECMHRDASMDASMDNCDSLGGWKRVPSRPQGILPRLLLRRHASKPPRAAFKFLTRTTSAQSSPLISPAQ